MLSRRIKFSAILLNALLAIGTASANESVDVLNNTLSDLREQGVDLGFTHKSDVLAVMDGGLKRGVGWMGHTEARLGIDLDKILGWSSTNIYLHYHSDLGSKFNRDRVGAVVGVDNIEVATNTAQFYQAWVQKGFIKDRLSILAGIYPIDSEFYVTDTSALFIQPPYGMSNELAMSGRAGPPAFPLGALALRIKYKTENENFYLMGALSDGVPGDPDHHHGTHIKLGHGDGTMSIVELGYSPHSEIDVDQKKESAELFNKTAIGFWRYSAKFDALDGISSQSHSGGAYILSERTLWVEPGHPSEGLAGFMRFGVANASINPLDWTASLGMRYHGLITGRDNDIAGIAVTVNHASSHLHASESQETNFEATYRLQLRPWLAIQPNFQYILHPGLNTNIGNAWIVGVRTELTI